MNPLERHLERYAREGKLASALYLVWDFDKPWLDSEPAVRFEQKIRLLADGTLEKGPQRVTNPVEANRVLCWALSCIKLGRFQELEPAQMLEQEITIGTEKGAWLHRQLGTLLERGINHYTYATQILGRTVTSLSTLTPSERDAVLDVAIELAKERSVA